MSLELIKSLPLIPLWFVLGAGCVAAFSDIWSFKIPNYITFPLLITGVLFHAFAPIGQGITMAMLGIFAGFACLILFYVVGGVGAGDVKLLAAIGAWIGPLGLVALFTVAAVLMGLYVTGLAVWQGRLQQTWIKSTLILRQGMTIVKHLGPDERVEEVAKRSDRRKHLVPFAVMVLAGLAVLLVAKLVVH
jgi:prepilin peptidase CpaA